MADLEAEISLLSPEIYQVIHDSPDLVDHEGKPLPYREFKAIVDEHIVKLRALMRQDLE